MLEEQQRFRQYLSEVLQMQKREEKEMEQLLEEKIKEVSVKQEEQIWRQREARKRLMDEVKEGRRLQIQYKRKEAKPHQKISVMFHDL